MAAEAEAGPVAPLLPPAAADAKVSASSSLASMAVYVSKNPRLLIESSVRKTISMDSPLDVNLDKSLGSFWPCRANQLSVSRVFVF